MADNQDIPMWMRAVIGVVVFGITVGGVTWAASQGSANHSFIVESHEKRITKVESEVDDLDGRLDNTEKMQIGIIKDQAAILRGQQKTEDKLDEFSALFIEQIKANAEVMQYMKSIENIN